MTSRVERFEEVIEEEPTPPPDLDTLIAPLRDLAQALQQRGGVGAEVKESSDDRRWQLILWPLHRPAFKSIMLSVHVYGGRVFVPNDGQTLACESAEAFTTWLIEFAAKPTFKASLSALKNQATETVDARLERANGMATLAGVSAETQEQLDHLEVGATAEIEVELAPREPAPTPDAVVRLRSAGLVFDVRDVQLDGRRVRFTVEKRAEN